MREEYYTLELKKLTLGIKHITMSPKKGTIPWEKYKHRNQCSPFPWVQMAGFKLSFLWAFSKIKDEEMIGYG